MNRDESLQLCRGLFTGEKAAGRVFYVVNRQYNALLRLPTIEDLTSGLETQEASKPSRVKPTQVVITRADKDWNPVLINTEAGRKVPDCWASGLAKVGENFDYDPSVLANGAARSTRKPGKPCAYILLNETIIVTWDRGEETWVAGSFMSCWDEAAMNSFTAITPVSFDQMKEPENAASASILARLSGKPVN